MNERIRELAKEALVEHCISHVRLEDFAQRIIRECADIADTAEPFVASDLILSHFGVNK